MVFFSVIQTENLSTPFQINRSIDEDPSTSGQSIEMFDKIEDIANNVYDLPVTNFSEPQINPK